MISATLYSDPACPWAYSESPALRVLEWRYGAQLDWRLVLIGLTEDASQYEAARLHAAARRARPAALPPLRDAVRAARRRTASARPRARAARSSPPGSPSPGSEWRVFRALQLANFTTPLLLDDDAQLRDVLRRVPGIDADAIVSSLDSPEVTEAYKRDRAETRAAAGIGRRAAGKDGDHATAGALHRPVDRVPVKRDAARRRRLPARRGLRRAGRQPRPDAATASRRRRPPSRCSSTSAAGHDPGGRGAADAQQRRARSRRPPRRRWSSSSPRARPCASRWATTRSGSRAGLADARSSARASERNRSGSARARRSPTASRTPARRRARSRAPARPGTRVPPASRARARLAPTQ